jgi:hypothetical protein
MRRLRQFPNQRVLASAGTDDREFHVVLVTVLSGFKTIRKSLFPR